MANVGGQAVLEGVMMRGPGHWAVAVRTPKGDIAQVSQSISSPMARHGVWRLPVVRGVLARGALIFAFVIAIGFALVLFKLTPGFITEALPVKGTWFALVEGGIRIVL